MKERLNAGETIELENEEDFFMLWFSSKTKRYCLSRNSKMVIASKVWRKVETVLLTYGDLTETE